mgnify:CR=1 FL=1
MPYFRGTSLEIKLYFYYTYKCDPMSIVHFRPNIKKLDQKRRETLVFSAILVLVGVGCFGIGMLAERSRLEAKNEAIGLDSVIITKDVTLFEDRALLATASMQTGNYFASRNGTAYYPVGCKAGDRVHSENRIYFGNMSEAELAGYKQSSSCTF